MANIFLSYDREDAARARSVAAVLEKAGHSVWWDRHITGGAQYSKEIEAALKLADAVVVLWSRRSVDSAWVRDEAAAGRDTNRLVPVRLDSTEPPMGFRQYQTIDLASGRLGRSARAALLGAIDGLAAAGSNAGARSDDDRQTATARETTKRAQIAKLAAIVAVVLLLGAATWWLMGRDKMPVVAIAAADPSPRSQAAANNLYVKLGSLAQIGEGRWQLVDASAGTQSDLVFRTADLDAAEPRANLVLIDGKRNVLLWSREFAVPGGVLADLRQQVSLTAGRVLGCALEARDAGGLEIDLQKRFLEACAAGAEMSVNDPSILEKFRSILAAEPKFRPAWGRLLNARVAALDLAESEEAGRAVAERALRADIAAAKGVDPTIAAIPLAEARLLPKTAYGEVIDLLEKTASQSPDDSMVQAALSHALLQVGRMNDGVLAAQRAAQFDPLSPAYGTHLILAMAYAGRMDDARRELEQFARLWPGTGALRDAMWAFHLRFGEPAVAMRYAPFEATGEGVRIYLDARVDRSTEKVTQLANFINRRRSPAERQHAAGWALYALGEFGLVDDAFAWMADISTDKLAELSYMFFREPMAPLRADPRFIGVAKRIGLVDYWRESGKWPDFCSQRGLPYDCKVEAAKLS